ncbi:MAG: class I SAM-dependent methyltransferase, partial [Rhodothermales bacterium]
RILDRVLDNLDLPADAALLEAGCGTGGNLAMLARHGRLRAFEIDDGAREVADKRGVTDVAAGVLPEPIPFEDERFDLIAMLDVLEHVADDRAALVNLRARLKPGGRLLLTVPAYMFLWSRHDEINHHHRRYVRDELATRVREAGYHVRYASYFNTLLFPFVLGIRTLNNLLGRDEGSDLAMPSPLVNKLLTRVFASERHLVPRTALPLGVSILLVAQRSG